MSEGSEEPKPIAHQEPQLDAQPARNNQRQQRHMIRALAIAILGGGGCTAIASLIARVVTPPHDIWVVALGVLCSLIAMAVGAYEILQGWTKTIVMVLLALALFDFYFADKWTQEIWIAQASRPEREVTDLGSSKQFEPPRLNLPLRLMS
jgi:hypothetical protein